MRLRDHSAVVSREPLRLDPRQLKVDPAFNVRDFTTPDARTTHMEAAQ